MALTLYMAIEMASSFKVAIGDGGMLKSSKIASRFYTFKHEHPRALFSHSPFRGVSNRANSA